ncbi:MAG: hypothetical protein KJN67_04445 [Pontiella sp.]|nr:hypothetical protein [Pontiella sp.]
MATVIFDLDDPGNQTVLDVNGYRVDRIAIVEGLAPASKDRVVYDAITDAGVPDIGDVHPTISSIVCTKITGRAIDKTTARLVVSYKVDQGEASQSSDATATISATTTQEEQNVDKNGDAMDTIFVVTNTPFSWTIYDEQFTAQVEKPRPRFEFEYKSSTHPITGINTYLGHVNSVTWNGYAAGKILCTEIHAIPEGDQYQIKYVFVLNPDGWQFDARISEPVGNAASTTDTDLDLDTGIKSFDVYPTVSFAPLGFTFDT